MEEANIIIEFIDQPNVNGLKKNRLFFPVLTPEDTDNYKDFQNRHKEYFVPLGTSASPNPYVCGSTDAAIDMLQRFLIKKDFKNRRVLISAGPTIEDIDPVRYLSNRSTGKMGIALAGAAYIRGAETELVLGPGRAFPPPHLTTIRVRSAKEMAKAVLDRFDSCDIYIGAAAIADFTPDMIAKNKIKKTAQDLSLNLVRTTDILSALKNKGKGQIVIGFSVETENIIQNSQKKLINKNLNFVVANNPGQAGAGFAAETNIATIIYRDGKTESFPLMSKLELSNLILDRILKLPVR